MGYSCLVFVVCVVELQCVFGDCGCLIHVCTCFYMAGVVLYSYVSVVVRCSNMPYTVCHVFMFEMCVGLFKANKIN